jgi:hypothetical protein
MNKGIIAIIINILQGASWALVVIISSYLFFHMLPYGFFTALFSALFGSFVGLFFVSFFELINISYKNLLENQKQTKLLEEIAKKLKA